MKTMDIDFGRPGVSPRIVLGALIIKHMMKFDNRGTVEAIQENPYMQFFVGLSGFTLKPVFDPSLFVEIRKRVGCQAFDGLTSELIKAATGNPEQTNNNHILQIPAEFYTPVDKGLIPTGKIVPVGGTPFDFREPMAIGEIIKMDHEQLKFGKGYDHNWVLDVVGGKKDNRLATRVKEPVSGRVMEVYTNESSIQFYGGNFLNGKDIGKNGIAYQYRTTFCLEIQHFPDSPNKENFPFTLLSTGEKYYSICIYRFSTKNTLI